MDGWTISIWCLVLLSVRSISTESKLVLLLQGRDQFLGHVRFSKELTGSTPNQTSLNPRERLITLSAQEAVVSVRILSYSRVYISMTRDSQWRKSQMDFIVSTRMQIVC